MNPLFAQDDYSPQNISTPNIPVEIWNEVLNKIHPKDKRTLLSALLVNRQWCLLAVPILWSRLSYFDKAIKVYINVLFLLHPDSVAFSTLGLIPDATPPTFVYTAYMRHFYFSSLFENTSWALFDKPLCNISEKERSKVSILFRELSCLIFETSTGLENISMCMDSYNIKQAPKENLILSEFPKAAMALKHIRMLEISGDYWQHNFLTSLSKITNEIEYIFLDCRGGDEPAHRETGLSALVRAQLNVRHILVTNCNPSSSRTLCFINDAAHSLRSLVFDRANMRAFSKETLEGLKSCRNLQILDLTNCSNLETSEFLPVADTFTRLRYLWIKSSHTGFPSEFIKAVVAASNKNLEFLYLDPKNYDKHLRKDVVKTICHQATNLQFLMVPLLEGPEIRQLVRSLPKLVDFIVTVCSSTAVTYLIGQLRDEIPPTLRHLKITLKGGQKIIPGAVEIFLADPNVKLESFSINFMCYGTVQAYPLGRLNHIRASYISSSLVIR